MPSLPVDVVTCRSRRRGEGRTGAGRGRDTDRRTVAQRDERPSRTTSGNRSRALERAAAGAYPPCDVDLVYSFLVGVALVSSAVAAFRFARPRRVLSPQGSAMETALHAASATLPHLRRGLSRQSAGKAAPHLLTLTQAAAIAITDDRT